MKLNVLIVSAALALAACEVGYDERLEYVVLATMTQLEVPDSSLHSDVRVRLAGIIGTTTAYAFDRLVWERTDSLFEFAVYGRQVEVQGETYPPYDVTFDTTLVLVLAPADTGRRYFHAVGATGILSDSTIVF